MGTLRDRIEQLVMGIGGDERLDAPAAAMAGAVNTAMAPTPVKNALSGTWLGHPVHPLLVALPIGSWAGTTALDLLGGDGAHDAADLLLGVGLASTVPTVATGLANWSDLFGADRRIGLVHAASNTVAAACFAASLLQRRRGKRGTGMLLQTAGLGAMTVGGYLGGHLSYRRGVGVDHTAFQQAAGDWTAVARFAELTEGKPHLAHAGDVPLLLVREGDGVKAIADVCSHEGGPLHDGQVSDGCVTCPWHDSVFALDDGRVVRGPATAPQPRYQVRLLEGDVQVRTTDAE